MKERKQKAGFLPLNYKAYIAKINKPILRIMATVKIVMVEIYFILSKSILHLLN